ncbi:MAG TPA: hypothetical protein VGR29_02905 [Thermomicrobiales bacterium]|nr:hypothetical protein [Thermomicrobiales bacterium]
MNAGLFTYAWDLEAEGYDVAVGRIAEAGFTSINLATSYHAGKFLLPRNPRRRVYFAEDGALFFRPDPSRYGRIQPRVHSLAQQDDDPVTKLLAAIRPYNLAYTAWTVCLHNSWLGERYPDTTMHTAFGDPLIHSLSPAHPDIRAYMVAMVTDLVSRYEAAAIQLESPGYMGFLHGYHHEIIGADLDAVQQQLLAISFNPVELAGAREAGIDAERLRSWVAGLLDACWNQGVPLMDGDSPASGVQDLFDDAEFMGYRTWQADQVVSLSQEIRDAVKAANFQAQIFHFAALDGSDADERLIATGDGILTGYASSDEDATRRAKRAAACGKRVHGQIRAIAPDTTDPAMIASRMEAWRASGVDGVDIYNYGLMPGVMWDAVVETVKGLQ